MDLIEEERRKRALTDDDVEALVTSLEKRILGRFYLNIGKGFMGMIWKGIIVVACVLAAYGAGVKGIKW